MPARGLHPTALDTRLAELKPITCVGSIPVEWECSDCGQRFKLAPMTGRDTNPKVVVFHEFERHKCVAKAPRSRHQSPLRKLAERRRPAR